MTEETLVKANELKKKLDDYKQNLKTVKNQLKHPVDTEGPDPLDSYVRYGAQHPLPIPISLYVSIAEMIEQKYEDALFDLQKEFNEL